MGKTEIYYFTGTGNSLFVAKELQKRIPEAELIPVLSLLNKDKIETNGESVGFVFPIHLTSTPIPVKDFIEKLDLTSAKYIFAIATRIGTTHGAFISIEKVLKRKGKRLDSYFTLNMPGNDPKFDYIVPTDEKIAALESVVLSRLDSIQNIIINKKISLEKDTNFTVNVPFIRFFSILTSLSQSLKVNFYSDSKCTGCGICERVCTSGKIKVLNNKPVWQENIKCYHCSACLSYCPVQSIQIKSYTEKNGRYSHPYATIDDIAGQK